MSLAFLSLLVLAGCGSPPISEVEYESRLTALDGVTTAYFNRSENLPFVFEFQSSVGVESDITPDQLRALFHELDAMPGFNSYAVYEAIEHPRGVRWEARDVPTMNQLEFLAEMWPVAAALPEETSVEFDHRMSTDTIRLEWRPSGQTEPETNARMATEFASQVAQADARVALSVGIPYVGFDGVPGECPGLGDAVNTLVDTADVTSLDVRCDDRENRIIASVLDDATTVAEHLEQPLRALGFTLAITPDGFRANAELSEALLADITAIVAASQQVPGAPSARSTSSGIDFHSTDEETARSVIAAIEPLPEYDRISVTLHVTVPESDSTLTISKGPGQRLYLDPLIAIGRQPGFMSLRAKTNFAGDVEQDVHLNAASVEEAVTILAEAGFRDAEGIRLHVNVYANDRAIMRLAVVVQQDGTVAPSSDAVTDDAERRFLDEWNAGSPN